MIIDTKKYSSLLAKFAKISKLAQDYAADIPLWSSIIFEENKILYLGWRFQADAPYPTDERPEKPFIVNFDRFFKALKFFKGDVEIEIGNDIGVGKQFYLKKLDIDYSNFKLEKPEDLHYISAEGMLKHITFCTMAASTDKMDYAKYGVIIGKDKIMAMDSASSVAYVKLEESFLDTTVLLHLPWCNILKDIGELDKIAVQDVAENNAILYIEAGNGFKLIVPAIKVRPNPGIKMYVESFEEHAKVTITSSDIKKVELTTDDAYKFATIVDVDNQVYLESTSKVKGISTVPLGEGDVCGETITVSLEFLKKIASYSGELSIDLDNMVGFSRIDNQTYAFGLG